jgi:high frequency lysogenization protein
MTESTIAFAGMLQASELVRQIATSGNCSQQAARASLASVFNFEPESTADVYGGLEGVRLGLRVLVELFSARQRQDSLQSLNYALGLAKLGMQVERDRARQEALGRDIELVAPAWRDSDDSLDDSISSQLADVYQRHISSLPFRLSISGQPDYLKQSEKVAFIRALLLAGIRSAFLWRQVGGRQWRLVFQRRRMLREAESLLAA